MKRLLAILLMVGMLFAVMPAQAAETVIQDGIKVTLTTDKDSYEVDEWVNAQLNIQNTNSYPIENVRTSITAPEGYLLLNGSFAEFAELSAGGSCVYKNSMVAAPEKPVVIPQTGDDSHIGLWLILSILSFAGFCILAVKNRKAGRMMSMLLCVVLVSTLGPSPVPARADVVTKTIVVTKQVTVGGESAVVRGTVTYDTTETIRFDDFICVYDEASNGWIIVDYVGTDKDITVPANFNGKQVTDIAMDAFDGHDGITLYVGAGSAAEHYAQAMGIPYVVIGATPAPTVTATPTVTPTVTPTTTPTAMPTPTPTATKLPSPVSYFVYEIVDGECIITGYCGPSSETYVVIPEMIEGCPVVEIAKNAFKNQKNIETLELPARLKKIGDFAFSSCDKLTSITIPRSVTFIGRNPFICRNLKTISVEPGNTEYRSVDGMLVHQSTQTLITYPCAFNTSFSAYSGYTIPYGIRIVGPYAFDSCRMSTVKIPGSVWKVEDYAFNNCANLSAAYIPESVTSISYTAFGTASLGGSYIFIYGIAGSAAEKSAPYMLASVIFVAVGADKFPVPAPTATPSPTPTPVPTPTATPEPEEDFATTAEMRYVNQFFGNLSDPAASSWSEMGLQLCKWLDMDERTVSDRRNSGYLMLEEEYLHHKDTLFEANTVWWVNKTLETVGDTGTNLILDFANHAALMTKFGTRGAFAVPYYQQLADSYLSFLQSLENEMTMMDTALSTVLDWIENGQILANQKKVEDAIKAIQNSDEWKKLTTTQQKALNAAQKNLTADVAKLENQKYQELIDECDIDYNFAKTAAAWYEAFVNFQNLSYQQQLYMSAFSAVTNEHLYALLELRNNLHTYSSMESIEIKNVDAAIGAMICDIHTARNNHMNSAAKADWNAMLGSARPLVDALFNSAELFDIPLLSFSENIITKAVSKKSFDSVTAVASIGNYFITLIADGLDYFSFRDSTKATHSLKLAMTESLISQLEEYRNEPSHLKAVAIINNLKLLKQMKLSGEELVALHYLSNNAYKLGLSESPNAMAILWNELITNNSTNSYEFNADEYTKPIWTLYEERISIKSKEQEPITNKWNIEYTRVSAPVAFYSYETNKPQVVYKRNPLYYITDMFLYTAGTEEWYPENSDILKAANINTLYPTYDVLNLGKETAETSIITQSEAEKLMVNAYAGDKKDVENLKKAHVHFVKENIYRRGSVEIRISQEEYDKYRYAEQKLEELLNEYKSISAIDYEKHQIEERLIWTRITNRYIESFPMFDPYHPTGYLK